MSHHLWAIGLTLSVLLRLAAGLQHKNPQHVTYSKEAVSTLTFLYDHIQDDEFGFCAIGKMTDDTAKVEKIELAHIERAYPDSIYASCPHKKNVIGFGHSHRKVYGNFACDFSVPDIYYIAWAPFPMGFVLCWNPTKGPEGAMGVLMLRKTKALELLKKGGHDDAPEDPARHLHRP